MGLHHRKGKRKGSICLKLDMGTETKLEQAKTYVLEEFLPGWPNGSFAELERKFKEKGFVQKVIPTVDPDDPTEEITTTSISSKATPNVVLWITENQLVADVFIALDNEKKISASPTSPMIYMVDGVGLRLPIPKSVDQIKKNPDIAYWLPVVLNSPSVHDRQERQRRYVENQIKEFKKVTTTSSLVKKHICASGIGFYLTGDRESEEYQDIEFLFDEIYHTEEWLKHSEKCEMPNPDQVKTCKEFIEQKCTPSKTIVKEATSYGYKHQVERWVDKTRERHQYISNGSFIIAALDLGFQMEQDEPTSLNAYFNFSSDAKYHSW